MTSEYERSVWNRWDYKNDVAVYVQAKIMVGMLKPGVVFTGEEIARQLADMETVNRYSLTDEIAKIYYFDQYDRVESSWAGRSTEAVLEELAGRGIISRRKRRGEKRRFGFWTVEKGVTRKLHFADTDHLHDMPGLSESAVSEFLGDRLTRMPEKFWELWPGAKIKPRRLGYVRVSGLSQDYDQQISRLKDEGAEVIYEDKHTGTKMQRPGHDKLLRDARPGDTIMVTRLDRYARTTAEAIKEMDELIARGIKLQVLNMGIIFEAGADGKLTPTSKLIRTTFLAASEMERDMVVARMAEGKAWAKKNNPNYREGRRRVLSGTRLQQMLEYAQDHTSVETASAFGISKSTVDRRLAEAREAAAAETR